MNKIPKRTNRISRLKPSDVPLSEVNGWEHFILLFWSERRYARNLKEDGLSLGLAIITLLSFAITDLIFQYWPLHFMGLWMGLGLFLGLLYTGLHYVNQAPFLSVFYVLLGSVLLLLKQSGYADFPLTVFHWHLEQYAYAMLILVGVLGLVRRGWNALIWWQLDGIVDRYDQKGLDS